MLRHHSAVELIDRAVAAGLVTRRQDDQDARTIRIGLTARGSRVLRRLSTAHEDEVRHLAELLQPTLQRHTDAAG
jgi:DNA-binding MarR family transcriptional regulator